MTFLGGVSMKKKLCLAMCIIMMFTCGGCNSTSTDTTDTSNITELQDSYFKVWKDFICTDNPLDIDTYYSLLPENIRENSLYDEDDMKEIILSLNAFNEQQSWNESYNGLESSIEFVYEEDEISGTDLVTLNASFEATGIGKVDCLKYGTLKLHGNDANGDYQTYDIAEVFFIQKDGVCYVLDDVIGDAVTGSDSGSVILVLDNSDPLSMLMYYFF